MTLKKSGSWRSDDKFSIACAEWIETMPQTTTSTMAPTTAVRKEFTECPRLLTRNAWRNSMRFERETETLWGSVSSSELVMTIIRHTYWAIVNRIDF